MCRSSGDTWRPFPPGSRWDGLHGVITDLPAESAAEAQDILAHYGSLWRIEESFRVNKHDLSIRPVYHWVPRRIEAHIALTYLAFALLRHLQHRVAVRQNAVMSAPAIRAALLDVQSTLMKDGETGKLYRFPKAMSESARKIYRSLGLTRGLGNTEILSVRKIQEPERDPERRDGRRRGSGGRDGQKLNGPGVDLLFTLHNAFRTSAVREQKPIPNLETQTIAPLFTELKRGAV